MDEDVLDSITGDTDRVRATVTGPDGLCRMEDGDSRRVDMAVVLAVSDERILFVPRDASGPEDAGILEYGDLAATTCEDRTLELSTVDGVTWQFPLPGDGTGAAIRHLQWVGDLRARLLAVRNDVRLAAGTIEVDADEGNYGDAEATYAELRDRLDELLCLVQVTAVPDEVLAPRLTELERTLETARGHLAICRAEANVDLAGQLIDNGDYAQAEPFLERAHEHRRHARNSVEAVRRGDAFRFGEHRDLGAALDRLDWAAETVAAGPLRQAKTARLRAGAADDAAAAVEDWERALARYEAVAALDLAAGPAAGDPAAVAGDLRAAADGLIDCRVELARRCWNRGADRADEDLDGALDCWRDAEAHLRRAVGVAEEHRRERLDRLAARHERVCDGLRRLRAAGVLRRRSDRGTPLGGAEGGRPRTVAAVADRASADLRYRRAGDEGPEAVDEFVRSARVGRH